jgi:hypothetical protein
MKIENLSNLLKNTRLENNKIQIWWFVLQWKKYEWKKFEYLDDSTQLLWRSHTYIFPVENNELIFSMQLYKNTSWHYRIFWKTKIRWVLWMTFSINLTTEEDEKWAIFLNQKIKFTERIEWNLKIWKQHRRMKQTVFINFLKKLWFTITDNNDLILWIYNISTNDFLNTSVEKFIEDFIIISLLKWHFMWNKGYQLEILPSYQFNQDIKYDDIDENILPQKIKKNKSSRAIPLWLRFKVLDRDNWKCKLCWISAKEWAKLHIDHIKPYSLWWLTVLENLQTLCLECNIGKSNKSSKKY